ncbi:MAG: glycosyltransferase [Bacteroidetes bacterium]|nr:glycosyltransferase [Bacteroidota bacterium]
MHPTLSFTLQLLFWLAAGLVVYSYVLFPLLLRVWAGDRHHLPGPPGGEQRLPPLSILMAAHNEEAAIALRLENLLAADYPHPHDILIGTDACTDATNEIIRSYQARHLNIRLFAFETRQGKPAIINQLVLEAQHPILLLTDANIFFRQDTLTRLGRHFVDPRVGVVSSAFASQPAGTLGISRQEKSYLQYESRLKFQEGLLFGSCIGANGGCYAIRKDDYVPTPPRFVADDFFIGMQVLLRGKRCLLDPDSVAELPVMPQARREFRRRVRISAGNFQNLRYFWWKAFRLKPTALVCYGSHKVLRWLTPFLLLLCLLINPFLWDVHPGYRLTLLGQSLLLAITLLDSLWGERPMLPVIRAIRHFYVMNLALLVGFFRWMRGIRSSTWTPSRRVVQ